jgi:hypothetical protein
VIPATANNGKIGESGDLAVEGGEFEDFLEFCKYWDVTDSFG